MTTNDGTKLLDRTLDLMRRGDEQYALDLLFGGLLDLREHSDPADWRRFSKEVAMEHPLCSWIHEDPMTRRSFEKPRGYAGDAVLLDYIYGLREPQEDRAPRGSAVYRFAVGRPAASAVRRRRERVADLIDEVAAEHEGPIRVFSIASGHLREAESSRAVAEGRVESFTALDSDPESCSFVGQRFPDVEVRNESFTQLFRERSLRGSQDLVYSAGLFDYLDQRLASKLVACMFGMLRPGGRLMMTNFLPTVVDAGYMESFMGWELIYRDADQMADLASGLPAAEVEFVRVQKDSHRALASLEVARRGPIDQR